MKIIKPLFLIILSLLLLLIIFIYSPILAVDKNSQINIDFTDNERQWIRDHPVIRVANELDWPPFDFVEYKKPKGLAIDYINLLFTKIGLKAEFINGYSWFELLELFKHKEIDVMPVIYFSSERTKFTLYTKPYYKGKLAIFENKYNQIFKIDLPKMKVGIQHQDGSIIAIKKQMPEIKLIQLADNKDLVKKLSNKQLDAIIGNPLVFYYHAKKERIDNIQLSDYFNMNKEEQVNTSFHIGIRKDWLVLHQITQKAMDNTSDWEFYNIEKKWTSLKVINQINWKIISQIFSFILVIVLFLFWNNKQLNKELELKVKLRTKDLILLNKKLEKMANTDPLTNIYNRRYFFEIAKHQLKLVKREQSTLSIAMIDIDKFKNINDTYGHDIGDKVIQSLAHELTKILRDSDVFTRFGGEEFVILFPHTNLEGALKVAEKIRQIISSSSKVDKVSFTISIGVSEFIKEEESIDNVIKRADTALYKAKKAGRNRVEYIIANC